MMKGMNRLCGLTLSIALLLVGCASPRYIVVKRETLDEGQLASSYTLGPDPLQHTKYKTQKLHIFYNIPATMNSQGMYLLVKVLRKDFTIEERRVALQKPQGVYTYSVSGDEYQKTQGIFSYKVTLINKNQIVLDCVTQQMWVDLEDSKSITL